MKEGLIKDILMAIFPLLLTGVGYLLMTVIDLQEQIQLIQDNNQIARDQLKDDIEDEIHDLDKRVAVLESKQ
jgi:cell division protein FtsB